MRTKKQALVLYFATCLLAVFAVAIESDSLLLVVKPVIIPAIFFYYLSAKLTKTNPFVVIFMVLTFISDTIAMLDIRDSTLLVMVPYFLSYLILLHFAISDVKKTALEPYGIAIGIFMFVLVCAVTVMVVQFFSTEQQRLAVPILIYGAFLAAYAGIATAYFFSTASNMGLYMILSALMCVVSDVFFALYSLIALFPGYHWFNLAVQLFSYFFITKYFILRKN